MSKKFEQMICKKRFNRFLLNAARPTAAPPPRVQQTLREVTQGMGVRVATVIAPCGDFFSAAIFPGTTWFIPSDFISDLDISLTFVLVRGFSFRTSPVSGLFCVGV